MGFRLSEVARMPRPMKAERRYKERGCEGKTRFKTAASALGQADELYRVGKAEEGTLDTYACKHCGWWHCGHRYGTKDGLRSTPPGGRS